jgi:hypothetical protein
MGGYEEVKGKGRTGGGLWIRTDQAVGISWKLVGLDKKACRPTADGSGLKQGRSSYAFWLFPSRIFPSTTPTTFTLLTFCCLRTG